MRFHLLGHYDFFNLRKKRGRITRNMAFHFSRRWTLLVDVSIDQSLSLPARYHYEINNSKLVMDSAIVQVKHVQNLHTWKIPRYKNATGVMGPLFFSEVTVPGYEINC